MTGMLSLSSRSSMSGHGGTAANSRNGACRATAREREGVRWGASTKACCAALAVAASLMGCALEKTRHYTLEAGRVEIYVADRINVQHEWEARGGRGKVYGFAVPQDRTI